MSAEKRSRWLVAAGIAGAFVAGIIVAATFFVSDDKPGSTPQAPPAAALPSTQVPSSAVAPSSMPPGQASSSTAGSADRAQTSPTSVPSVPSPASAPSNVGDQRATAAGTAAATAPAAGDDRPAVPGEPAEASIQMADGTSRPLRANQLGVFERAPMAVRGTLDVQVSYPAGQTGQQVVATIQDGGVFSNGRNVAVLPLDSEKRIGFRFTAGQSPGVYHVELRKGTDVKIVEAWAGEELRLADGK